MRWSSAAARGLQHPTTVIIANNCDIASEVKLGTGPATAATVLHRELYFGIDVAGLKQVVTHFVPGEGAKPAEGMSSETLLRRVGRLIKDGFRAKGRALALGHRLPKEWWDVPGGSGRSLQPGQTVHRLHRLTQIKGHRARPAGLNLCQSVKSVDHPRTFRRTGSELQICRGKEAGARSDGVGGELSTTHPRTTATTIGGTSSLAKEPQSPSTGASTTAFYNLHLGRD